MILFAQAQESLNFFEGPGFRLRFFKGPPSLGYSQFTLGPGNLLREHGRLYKQFVLQESLEYQLNMEDISWGFWEKIRMSTKYTNIKRSRTF